MDRNTIGKFFYLLGKVPTENNLCNTSGNILNIDKSGMKVNNKPDFVITEKRSKYAHV